MRKNIKLSLAIIMLTGMLFCLNGCAKSEADYKSAISEHMGTEHGVSIRAYSNFRIREDGSASADISIPVGVEGGGSMDMNNSLTVDKDCHISSCGWCKLGLKISD